MQNHTYSLERSFKTILIIASKLTILPINIMINKPIDYMKI